ncbi:hypothetical protein ABW19_dt0203890 [Dactylella cylindrospora]|nr:hypothetical protein ABW19_dt0203890 [Dactylella cylindrospora]
MLSKLPSLVIFTLLTLTVASATKVPAIHRPVGRSLAQPFFPVHDLSKRQTVCDPGQGVCSDATQSFCAHVCCFVGDVLIGSCYENTYCIGTADDLACCPDGQICDGPVAPCVDATETVFDTATFVCPICSTISGENACVGSLSDYTSMLAGMETGAATTPAATPVPTSTPSTPTPTLNPNPASTQTTPAATEDGGEDSPEETRSTSQQASTTASAAASGTPSGAAGLVNVPGFELVVAAAGVGFALF